MGESTGATYLYDDGAWNAVARWGTARRAGWRSTRLLADCSGQHLLFSVLLSRLGPAHGDDRIRPQAHVHSYRPQGSLLARVGYPQI